MDVSYNQHTSAVGRMSHQRCDAHPQCCTTTCHPVADEGLGFDRRFHKEIFNGLVGKIHKKPLGFTIKYGFTMDI